MPTPVLHSKGIQSIEFRWAGLSPQPMTLLTRSPQLFSSCRNVFLFACVVLLILSATFKPKLFVIILAVGQATCGGQCELGLRIDSGTEPHDSGRFVTWRHFLLVMFKIGVPSDWWLSFRFAFNWGCSKTIYQRTLRRNFCKLNVVLRTDKLKKE